MINKFLVILFMAGMLISGALLASNSHDDNYFFKVLIYNNMQYNCDLVSLPRPIRDGYLRTGIPIPIYLAPGSINQFVLIEKNKFVGATVELTYHCEGGRHITILSHSDLSARKRENQIRFRVFNPGNMTAVVTKQVQDFFSGFSEINWVFEASP